MECQKQRQGDILRASENLWPLVMIGMLRGAPCSGTSVTVRAELCGPGGRPVLSPAGCWVGDAESIKVQVSPT